MPAIAPRSGDVGHHGSLTACQRNPAENRAVLAVFTCASLVLWASSVAGVRLSGRVG